MAAYADYIGNDVIQDRFREHLTAALPLSYTEEELVDPMAAACGQIIYDLLMEMGAVLDRPMANALHIAVATDTGCFRFGNTQSHTLEVAAACARVSTDISAINRNIFSVMSLKRLRLQGWMVENMHLFGEGRIAICGLPLAVERAMELTEDDMENISGFLRAIEGVLIGAMLRENPDGTLKLSVRCQQEYDAGGICAKFGGGGHRGAAGATLHMPMDEAIAAVYAAMPTL